MVPNRTPAKATKPAKENFEWVTERHYCCKSCKVDYGPSVPAVGAICECCQKMYNDPRNYIYPDDKWVKYKKALPKK